MLDFFKKIFSGNTRRDIEILTKNVQEESVLSEEQLVQGTSIRAGTNEQGKQNKEIDVKLSLHETWEREVDQEQKYILSFIHDSLSKVRSGQISLVGFDLAAHPEGIAVSAFIRNGLSRSIQFKTIPLVFIAGDGNVIASQQFETECVGEIPPHTSRPWTFIFTHDAIVYPNPPLSTWKLAFEVETRNEEVELSMDFDLLWEKDLSAEERSYFVSRMLDLTPVKSNEVNITGIDIECIDQDGYAVLMFFRNGSSRSINVGQLHLTLEDAMGEIVARGLFDMKKAEIRAMTCKPWRFLFQKELIMKKNPDLSNWCVRIQDI